jgi:Winged helix-turn-helix DNA-binding
VSESRVRAVMRVVAAAPVNARMRPAVGRDLRRHPRRLVSLVGLAPRTARRGIDVAGSPNRHASFAERSQVHSSQPTRLDSPDRVGFAERDARTTSPRFKGGGVQQVIDTLEAERAEVQERLAWLDQQINEFQTYNGSPATAAPTRSVRRSTARRASNRRATARSHQSDIKASIIEFLAKHPESTAGDIAKALNLNPGSVSTRLTQLAKTGQIQKASRGYSVK